jgi:hypothetical protein
MGATGSTADSGGERKGERVSIFEYLAIAYSLVFSFAAMRLVAGLPHAVAPGRRYNVHLSHVFLILFSTATLFWGFWSFRELEWNLLRFMSLLAGPGMLYFLACTLIPDEPSSVGSWHHYFYSVRRQYFFGLCLWSLLQTANTTFLLEMPVFHPFRLVQLFILTMGIAGFVSGSPAVHRIIAIGSWTVAVFTSVILFLPGSLAS